ncbi:DinB family protein [Pedobacter sp. HMF7647]|uniref:DinB family protein n=1 Tax=Hufsiella arboris TaxID=2695275 RepID=A0A7K1Y9J0_9SPHI|nr:DinB family protein [Hufsiella arboris]
MESQVANILNVRTYLLDQIKDFSVEQLNKIPDGFNNNIIWNLGHLTSAMQGLCYKRSGLKPAVEEQYVEPFIPGSKPEKYYNEEDVNAIKELLLSSPLKLQDDYQRGIFQEYTTVTTRYNVTLSNIDEAIDFVLFHEGLHAGYVMAMRKLV